MFVSIQLHDDQLHIVHGDQWPSAVRRAQLHPERTVSRLFRRLRM